MRKTRIVQTLFDETVGNDPLDRTIAVYVDTGQDPDPSASAMLDLLIAEGRRAVIILDSCPCDLHSALATKVSVAGTQTCSRRHSCYGQQDRPDRLGRSDPQRTIQPTTGLRKKEQRVSKTREMMVHKSAAKTKTLRQMARAS